MFCFQRFASNVQTHLFRMFFDLQAYTNRFTWYSFFFLSSAFPFSVYLLLSSVFPLRWFSSCFFVLLLPLWSFFFFSCFFFFFFCFCFFCFFPPLSSHCWIFLGCFSFPARFHSSSGLCFCLARLSACSLCLLSDPFFSLCFFSSICIYVFCVFFLCHFLPFLLSFSGLSCLSCLFLMCSVFFLCFFLLSSSRLIFPIIFRILFLFLYPYARLAYPFEMNTDSQNWRTEVPRSIKNWTFEIHAPNLRTARFEIKNLFKSLKQFGGADLRIRFRYYRTNAPKLQPCSSKQSIPNS